MGFLELLEFKNINFIKLIFLLNFFVVFFISYPVGHFIYSRKSKDLLFCSFISISLMAVLIGIIVNYLAFIGKYLIIFYFLLNLGLIINNKSIFKDLINEIKKNYLFFLSIPFIYFIILVFLYPVELDENFVEIPYQRHLIYYFAPIQEILNADYLSRIKISTLFPMEWASFYFFQGAFNSIYLNVLYQFGYIGLIFLKGFFFSLLFANLILFLIEKIKFKKQSSFYKFLLLIFIVNFIYYLFIVSNLNWSLFGNETIVIFSLYFLFKNLFIKNKYNLITSCFLLSFGSFKNLLLSFLLLAYSLLPKLNHNIKSHFKLIKSNYIFLSFFYLLISYLFITFFSSINVLGKFNMIGDFSLWKPTFTFKIINNDYLFLSFLIILFFLKITNLSKNSFLRFKKDFFTSLIIILLIPLFSFILILSKGTVVEISNNTNIEKFLNSFNITNLKFYFLVPLLWVSILIFSNDIFKIFILALITFYTGVSIFVSNHVLLPAIYTLEIFLILWLAYTFISKKNNLNNRIMMIVVIIFINTSYLMSVKKEESKSLILNLDKLAIFKDVKYLCPDHIKKFKDYNNVIESDLLSGLLNKRYYSDLAYDKEFNAYNHFYLAVPMAVPSKIPFEDPCER